MGLTEPKVIENDAIVVLCLKDDNDGMTHHQFKVRAAHLGFTLTQADCHNMLHRAMGRVNYNSNKEWFLTVSGVVYRQHVIDTMRSILRATIGT